MAYRNSNLLNSLRNTWDDEVNQTNNSNNFQNREQDPYDYENHNQQNHHQNGSINSNNYSNSNSNNNNNNNNHNNSNYSDSNTLNRVFRFPFNSENSRIRGKFNQKFSDSNNFADSNDNNSNSLNSNNYYQLHHSNRTNNMAENHHSRGNSGNTMNHNDHMNNHNHHNNSKNNSQLGLPINNSDILKKLKDSNENLHKLYNLQLQLHESQNSNLDSTDNHRHSNDRNSHSQNDLDGDDWLNDRPDRNMSSSLSKSNSLNHPGNGSNKGIPVLKAIKNSINDSCQISEASMKSENLIKEANSDFNNLESDILVRQNFKNTFDRYMNKRPYQVISIVDSILSEASGSSNRARSGNAKQILQEKLDQLDNLPNLPGSTSKSSHPGESTNFMPNSLPELPIQMLGNSLPARFTDSLSQDFTDLLQKEENRRRTDSPDNESYDLTTRKHHNSDPNDKVKTDSGLSCSPRSCLENGLKDHLDELVLPTSVLTKSGSGKVKS